MSSRLLQFLRAAGELGGTLLEEVERSAPATEVAAATEHGHSTNLVSLSAFVLLTMAVVATVADWRQWTTRAVDVIGGMVALSGLGVILGTWLAVESALTAVWGG
jgi:hypothetical protein